MDASKAGPRTERWLLTCRDTEVLFLKDGVLSVRKIDYVARELQGRLLNMLVAMSRDLRLDAKGSELLGELLYSVLLADGIGTELNEVLNDNGRQVRLELEFTDPTSDLAKFPWEYLYRPSASPDDPRGGYYLAEQPALAIVRRPKGECRKLQMTGKAGAKKANILIVAASPTDKDRIEFDDLLQTLPLAMAELNFSFLRTDYKNAKVALIQMANDQKTGAGPQATWQGFRKKLKEGFDIVHFIGHGTAEKGGGIAFVDEGYRSHVVTAKELADELRNSSVRLVFLQACETSMEEKGGDYTVFTSVASCLAQNKIPAIVAMQSKVVNSEANQFAKAFYDALFKGEKALDRAVQQARDEIEIKERRFIPTLYLTQDSNKTNDEARFFDDQENQQSIDPNADPKRIRKCAYCGYPASLEGKFCQSCSGPIRCANAQCRWPIEISAGQKFLDEGKIYYCTECRTSYERPKATVDQVDTQPLANADQMAKPPQPIEFPQPPSMQPRTSPAMYRD
jgi:hypothetical protein